MSKHILDVPILTTRTACNPSIRPRLNTDEASQMALTFKAISHPVRLQILDLISQGDGLVCGCDIERHFDLTQPTISHHLKVLRDAGFITSEAQGVWISHKVNVELLNALRGVLSMMENGC